MTEVWVANHLTSNEDTYIDDILNWGFAADNILDINETLNLDDMVNIEWQEVWHLGGIVRATKEDAEAYAKEHNYPYIVRVTKARLHAIMKEFINEYETYQEKLNEKV